MLSSVPIEEVVRTVRPRPTRKLGIGNQVVLSTSVLVLLGLLIFATWRELVSEFDASIRDFASSLATHDRTDPR
jgi:hypothetical protein